MRGACPVRAHDGFPQCGRKQADPKFGEFASHTRLLHSTASGGRGNDEIGDGAKTKDIPRLPDRKGAGTIGVPLLVQVGSAESMLDDSTRLAERAGQFGVDVILEVWEGLNHGWHGSPHILPEARQAIRRIGDFFRRHVG